LGLGLAVRNAAEVFGFKKIAGAPRTPESGEEIYRIWKIPVRTVPRHKRVRVFYVNLSPAPPRGLLTMEAINSSRVSVCAHQALCSWGETERVISVTIRVDKCAKEEDFVSKMTPVPNCSGLLSFFFKNPEYTTVPGDTAVGLKAKLESFSINMEHSVPDRSSPQGTWALFSPSEELLKPWEPIEGFARAMYSKAYGLTLLWTFAYMQDRQSTFLGAFEKQEHD
jgi:hypothetical protein